MMVPGSQFNFDPSSVQEWLDKKKTKIATWIAMTIGLRLNLFLLKIVSRRGRYFSKLTTLCHVNCAFEVWTHIYKGSLLDTDSQTFKEIDAAITHYLMKSSTCRESFSFFEQRMLQTNVVYWHKRNLQDDQRLRHFRFVLKHRLATIIKRYVNLQNYINFLALKEVASIETALKENVSVFYWKHLVKFDQLPSPLQQNTRPRKLKSFLRKKLNKAKQEIARENYLKIDFALSDLTAFLTLSGALLLVLGYFRIAVIGWYFQFPYERYFGTTDYIAASLSSIDEYIAAAIVSGLLVFFVNATVKAHSLQSISHQSQSLSGRINSWQWHFLGISSILAVGIVFFQQHLLEPMSLGFACTYVGIYGISFVSRNFFVEPIKALVVLSLVLAAFTNALAGVAREINQITQKKPGALVRLLRFSDTIYNEPEWRVLAFTKDFVILRRQTDGTIQVRPKSELKAIDDAPKSQ
jgi:uncharacterized protein (DUF486 family)